MDRVERLLGRLEGAKLTPRGIVFVAVAGLALIVSYAAGWPALLAVALFLGGSVVAALASIVVAPPAITVDRRVDPVIAEQGEDVRVRLSVRGESGGTVEWAERLPTNVHAVGQARGRLRLRSHAALLEYTVVARRRGAQPIGPFGVVRSDPLGLAVTRRDIGAPSTLVVLPRISPIRVPAVVTRTDPDSVASTAFGPVGDQRDIVARTYRAGDPMRSVDWRATAHRGELMVRTEAAASSSATALALEARADAWGGEREFEWAVEYAASTAAALGDRRAVVHFAADRQAPVAEDAIGALVALATVQRSAAAPRPAELAKRLVGADVRVVHLVTGAGSAGELARLPALPSGTTGLVTVVGAVPPPTVPPGWRATVLDHRAPVSEAVPHG